MSRSQAAQRLRRAERWRRGARPRCGEVAREEVTAKALARDLRTWLTPEAPSEETADDFLAFFRRWVDGFAERGQPSTYKAYNTTCNRVTAYTGGRLRYDQLTPALCRGGGTRSPRRSHTGRGSGRTTSGNSSPRSRTAIRAAVREGHAPDDFRDPFEQARRGPAAPKRARREGAAHDRGGAGARSGAVRGGVDRRGGARRVRAAVLRGRDAVRRRVPAPVVGRRARQRGACRCGSLRGGEDGEADARSRSLPEARRSSIATRGGDPEQWRATGTCSRSSTGTTSRRRRSGGRP